MEENNELIFVKACVVIIEGFSGVCHVCNSPISYGGRVVVVKVAETQDTVTYVPVDSLTCLHCFNPVRGISIYKDLCVSAPESTHSQGCAR